MSTPNMIDIPAAWYGKDMAEGYILMDVQPNTSGYCRT